MGVERVSLASLGSYIHGLTEERRQAVVRATQTTCRTLGLALIQQEISGTSPPPVDRGSYRRGWKVYKFDDGAMILNSERHASVIERGRRAGARMPPVESIRGWVHRKGLAKVSGLKGKAKAAAELSMAWAIAKSIAKKGTEGRFVLKRVKARLMPALRQAIRVAAAGGGP